MRCEGYAQQQTAHNSHENARAYYANIVTGCGRAHIDTSIKSKRKYPIIVRRTTVVFGTNRRIVTVAP